MKILINEKQLHFLVEQVSNQPKIYNRTGDPYEYKFEGGKWFARKKGTDAKFLDISNYQKSIDILNKEFPQNNNQPTTQKPTEQKPAEQKPAEQKPVNQKPAAQQPAKKETKKTSPEDNQLNAYFYQRLNEVAKNLGFQKEWLIKIMQKESKMNPKVKNSIGCVGLIQFCPDTPGGSVKTLDDKKYDLETVRNMSAAKQLDLVELFFKPYASKIKSYEDLYLFTFYPYAVGKPEHFVIGSEKDDPKYALKISRQNPAIANAAGKTPGKDTLTVADFKKYAIA